MGDTAPWIIAAVIAPLLGLLAYAVKWMGTQLTDAIKQGSDAQVKSQAALEETIRQNTIALQGLVGDARVHHDLVRSSVDNLQDEIREAGRKESPCRLTQRGAFLLEEQAGAEKKPKGKGND